MMLAWTFSGCAVVLCVFALLALASIGQQGMLGKSGVERDGLKPGKEAPTWQATDLEGILRRSPNPGTWQLLLLADHSLKDFPEVVVGLGGVERSRTPCGGP
jgi:hypothetical protein